MAAVHGSLRDCLSDLLRKTLATSLVTVLVEDELQLSRRFRGGLHCRFVVAPFSCWLKENCRFLGVMTRCRRDLDGGCCRCGGCAISSGTVAGGCVVQRRQRERGGSFRRNNGVRLGAMVSAL